MSKGSMRRTRRTRKRQGARSKKSVRRYSKRSVRRYSKKRSRKSNRVLLSKKRKQRGGMMEARGSQDLDPGDSFVLEAGASAQVEAAAGGPGGERLPTGARGAENAAEEQPRLSQDLSGWWGTDVGNLHLRQDLLRIVGADTEKGRFTTAPTWPITDTQLTTINNLLTTKEKDASDAGEAARDAQAQKERLLVAQTELVTREEEAQGLLEECEKKRERESKAAVAAATAAATEEEKRAKAAAGKSESEVDKYKAAVRQVQATAAAQTRQARSPPAATPPTRWHATMSFISKAHRLVGSDSPSYPGSTITIDTGPGSGSGEPSGPHIFTVRKHKVVEGAGTEPLIVDKDLQPFPLKDLDLVEINPTTQTLTLRKKTKGYTGHHTIEISFPPNAGGAAAGTGHAAGTAALQPEQYRSTINHGGVEHGSHDAFAQAIQIITMIKGYLVKDLDNPRLPAIGCTFRLPGADAGGDMEERMF